MININVFEELLNIPKVRVLNVENKEQEISIEVEFVENHSICHRCGQRATKFHGHGKKLRLRHLPVFNKPVYLYLHPKRYQCLHCDDRPTTTQRGDWYDPHAECTQEFARFLLLEIVNSTLLDVSKKHDVSYDVLRGLLIRHVSDEVDWSKIKQLRVLGLDEISLLKGHRDFVTIVSALDEELRPVILAVLEGRTKERVVEFLRSIPEPLRATVEQVCTDLYEGYSSAVEEVLPGAKIVADRFHVAKLYRAALDELRKSEMKEIKAALKPEEYEAFKGVLWILRHNSEDLTEEELAILELLFECSPLLKKAYKLREKLTAIFETKQSRESAQKAIKAWISAVKRSGLECFDKFIKTLEERLDHILNYFISRFSSGWVEGLNNKIKVLKRRCYGITNPSSLFRRLFLDLKGYDLFAN